MIYLPSLSFVLYYAYRYIVSMENKKPRSNDGTFELLAHCICCDSLFYITRSFGMRRKCAMINIKHSTYFTCFDSSISLYPSLCIVCPCRMLCVCYRRCYFQLPNGQILSARIYILTFFFVVVIFRYFNSTFWRISIFFPLFWCSIVFWFSSEKLMKFLKGLSRWFLGSKKFQSCCHCSCRKHDFICDSLWIPNDLINAIRQIFKTKRNFWGKNTTQAA